MPGVGSSCRSGSCIGRDFGLTAGIGRAAPKAPSARRQGGPEGRGHQSVPPQAFRTPAGGRQCPPRNPVSGPLRAAAFAHGPVRESEGFEARYVAVGVRARGSGVRGAGGFGPAPSALRSRGLRRRAGLAAGPRVPRLEGRRGFAEAGAPRA